MAASWVRAAPAELSSTQFGNRAAQSSVICCKSLPCNQVRCVAANPTRVAAVGDGATAISHRVVQSNAEGADARAVSASSRPSSSAMLAASDRVRRAVSRLMRPMVRLALTTASPPIESRRRAAWSASRSMRSPRSGSSVMVSIALCTPHASAIALGHPVRSAKAWRASNAAACIVGSVSQVTMACSAHISGNPSSPRCAQSRALAAAWRARSC